MFYYVQYYTKPFTEMRKWKLIFSERYAGTVSEYWTRTTHLVIYDFFPIKMLAVGVLQILFYFLKNVVTFYQHKLFYKFKSE